MHGLYILYWVREQHVPAAIVATALVVGDVALTLLEVPTGWLADRFGHRASLIAGSVLQVAGMFFWWLGPGVPGLIAGSLCIALGDAFRSGADQALLYRSCAALGRTDAFQTIEARARATQLIVLVALILAGGAIVTRWGFAAGWIAEVLLSLAGLVVACAMVEPPRERGLPDGGSGLGAGGSGNDRAVASTGLVVWTALIVPAALVSCVVSAGSFFAQATDSIAPTRMTVLIAAITLGEAAGAFGARFFTARVSVQPMLAGIGAVVLACSAVWPTAFFPAIVTLSFLDGLARPLRATTIQQRADDSARARMASVASAVDKILAAIALMAAGILRR